MGDKFVETNYKELPKKAFPQKALGSCTSVGNSNAVVGGYGSE
jgi:hypothetical protein